MYLLSRAFWQYIIWPVNVELGGRKNKNQYVDLPPESKIVTDMTIKIRKKFA